MDWKSTGAEREYGQPMKPLDISPGRIRFANIFVSIFAITLTAETSLLSDQTRSAWEQAEANALDAQQAVAFSRRYAHGWLSFADLETGLLPRRISGDAYWNAKDCAADNFPFLVLTDHVLDDFYLKQTVHSMLQAERRLTTRVDGLPDTYDFLKQGFREETVQWDNILFGASEYVKDGLMPITEWMGPTAWEERMLELLYGIWRHAEVSTPAGPIPTNNIEVHGELLQSMSRMYWRTGDTRFKTWCYRLADQYLLHHHLLDHASIRLRDHGCEVISGLSETYLIASRQDPDRHARYREPFHRILDDILDHAVNPDGMMPNTYQPSKKGDMNLGISDGWGYVYNAYLTVADIDGVPRYREAVRHALENIHKYLDADWERGGADGYADSVEGALNMLNRLPVDTAFEWADQSIRKIWEKQRPDGIIEGWYGDGNSARTSLMYALWKTQGVAPNPWRDGLQIGAVEREGALHLWIQSQDFWSGTLRFDRLRHKDWFRLPVDYPRINQFPQWFTVSDDDKFDVQKDDRSVVILTGEQLRAYALQIKPGQNVRLLIKRHTRD